MNETPFYLVLILNRSEVGWYNNIFNGNQKFQDFCHFITIVDDCKILFQLDVVSFANLAQIYFVDKEVSFPLRDYMQESCANLAGLVNRMKEK